MKGFKDGNTPTRPSRPLFETDTRKEIFIEQTGRFKKKMPFPQN